MVIVAFRETNDKLASLCMETFSSAKAAKAYIKADAKFYCEKHGLKNYGVWKNPNEEDYFSVNVSNGNEAIWQYFQI